MVRDPWDCEPGQCGFGEWAKSRVLHGRYYRQCRLCDRREFRDGSALAIHDCDAYEVVSVVVVRST